MKKFAMIALSLVAGIVCAVEIPLGNPNFNRNRNGQMPYWNPTNRDLANGSTETVTLPDGKKALKITSNNGQVYLGISQHVAFKKFPVPQPGEKLRITLSYRQKNEDVERGGFVNMMAYGPKGRFLDKDSPRTSGTFDWKDFTFVQTIDKLPEDTKGFVVHLYLGKCTGTVWFSDVKLNAEIVK